MDDFREWLSDNLRYFMLGFGILAVVLILFLGVRFISSKFGSDTQEPKKEVEQEMETEADPTPAPEEEQEESQEEPVVTAEPEVTPEALENNAYPQVNALIQKYYTALTRKDVQSLKALVDELDPTDETAILNSQYIEGYSNVNVYTKPGMTDTSYVAFASYDHKYVGYDTLLPGISYLYVDTNEEGKLYIVAELDEEKQSYIAEKIQEDDVQELLNSTQTSYDEKLASDEALSNYLSELGVEGSAAMEAAEGTEITVKSNCNIRKEPSAEAEVIGKLVGGQKVIKAGQDGDWIKIELEGQTGYVRGDMFQ